MLKGKLIYIFLLFSFLSFGQNFETMLLASIQQASGGTVELYTSGGADDNVNETNAAIGWLSQGTGGTTISSVAVTNDGNTGDYAVQFVSVDGNADSAFNSPPLTFESGETYRIGIYARQTVGTNGFLRAFSDAISSWSTTALTSSWALYQQDIVASSTSGRIRIYPAYTSGVTGDTAQIGYISIVKL